MVAIHPMRIPGNWRQGFVLDYHTVKSEFLGYDEFGHPIFDTKRSEIGELLYRLKYRSDRTVVNIITETVVGFITKWNPRIDMVISVPPSRPRSYQPVIDIAGKIASQIKHPFQPDIVTKTKDTPELKNIYDYHERLKLLENAYIVTERVVLNKNILLFDDLYRSGATMNAITQTLQDQGQAANVYALALTRTRSNG